MFQLYSVVIYFTIVYVVAKCDSNCSEYTLIVRTEDTWDALDCEYEYTTSYEEIYANTTCVLELIQQPVCKDLITVNLKYIPSTCKAEVKTLPSTTNLQKETNKTLDEEKIDSLKDYINFTINKSITWQCEYGISKYHHELFPLDNQRHNIKEFQNCKQYNRNTIKRNNYTNSDIILILKKEAAVISSINKVKLYLHLVFNNESDCNSIMPFNITEGKIINKYGSIDEQRLSNITLAELKILNCITNIFSSDKPNRPYELNIVLNKSNNTEFNVSTMMDDLYKIKNNLTTIAILNCVHPDSEDFKNTSIITNNVKLVLKCTFTDIDALDDKKIKKEAQEEEINKSMNANNNTTSEHYPSLNIFGTTLEKSVIWRCKFSNLNNQNKLIAKHIFEQQHKNTNTIKFENCVEYLKNNNKSDHLYNSDIITNLIKDKYDFNETNIMNKSSTLYDVFWSQINKKILNSHLIFNNNSTCNKTMALIFKNGNTINTWTVDDDEITQSIYNATQVELNVSNCMPSIFEEDPNNEQGNKPLELNIVISKQNKTESNTSIMDDFSNIKTNLTFTAILDCMQSDTIEVKNSSKQNKSDKLILECNFIDVGGLDKNVKEKVMTKENKKQILQSNKSEKKSDKIQVYQETKENTKYQSGMKSDAQSDNEDTSLDPIVYVFIALITTVVISSITIFILKKYKKPVSYHVTSTRDWPNISDDML